MKYLHTYSFIVTLNLLKGWIIFLLFIKASSYTILFFLGVHIIAVAPTTRCQYPRPPLLLPSPSTSFTTIIISITLFSKTTCIPATQLLSMAVGSFTTLSDVMSVSFLDFHRYHYHHATVTDSTSPTASSIISLLSTLGLLSCI